MQTLVEEGVDVKAHGHCVEQQAMGQEVEEGKHRHLNEPGDALVGALGAEVRTQGNCSAFAMGVREALGSV